MSEERVMSRVFHLLGIGKPEMEQSFENRIKYQKIIYLLQSYGLSLDYGFTWYLKGPYSSPLAHTLYAIYNDNEIYDEYKNMKFKNDEEVDKTIQDFKQLLGEDIDNALYLEVLASLHYLNKAIFPREVDEEELKSKLFEHKPHLQNRGNIHDIVHKAYKQLEYYN